MSNLESILARLGAQVVKSEVSSTRATLMLRVRLDEVTRSKWAGFIEEILIREAAGKRKTWTADVGQVYFLSGGVPKYLWRIVLQAKNQKGIDAALEQAHGAAMQSLSKGVEVTSMPLVGRDTYAGAKTRGAHAYGSASSLISGGGS